MNSELSVIVGGAVFFVQAAVYLLARRSARVRGAQWMREVDSASRAAQTRDSALLDLERALASCPRASLLRKLGVIAPLLGVTLTALAFMASAGIMSDMLGASELAGDPGGPERSALIQRAISPLFLGVLVGALLAIFNQLLQALLARQEDAVIRVASSPALLGKFRDPDSAFERFAEGIRESTARLQEAAGLLEQMMSGSRTEFGALSDGARELSSELKSGAASFREAVETPAQEFAAAAGAMREAAQSVGSKMKSGFVTLGERSLKLQQLLESIAAAHEAETAKFAAASQGIEQALDGLRSASDQVRIAMAAVAGSIDRLEGRSASELSSHLERLRAATEQYVRMIEQASRSSSQQAAASGVLVESFEKGADAVRQAAVSLQEAARPWWRRRERGA